MKINIVGWYGMKNVGDEAFRCVFRQCLRGHDIKFVTPPSNCEDCEVVILGGGAVVSPFYLSQLPRNTCPLYAIGVDIAYESEMDLMSQFNFRGIMVRNSTDIETLRSKVPCSVEAIPDLAFYLRPSGTESLGHYRQFPNKKSVGVFLTDYVNPAIDRPISEFSDKAYSFKVRMAAELDKMTEDGYEVVLVPCATAGYGDDRRMNLDIAAFMNHTPTIVFDTLGPQEMIDLIADLDLAICMRFHAHIFAMIAGTPFVSVEYTRKVKLFLEENDLNKATGATWKNNEFDSTKLRETAVTVSNTEMSRYLRNTASSYRDELWEVMIRVRREWLPQST